MLHQPFSHISFVVGQLEAAMGHFSDALDICWREPWKVELTDETGVLTRTRAVYTEGPAPAIELVERVPGSIFDAAADIELHHLGFWTDTFVADVEMLDGRGCSMLSTQRDRAGKPGVFALHSTPLPFRVELADPRAYAPGKFLSFLADQVPDELHSMWPAGSG